MHLRSDTELSELVQKLTPHLRVELDARDIGICTGTLDPETAPLAEISLGHASLDDDAPLTITIRDRVTDKSVSRTVDLTGLPSDTRLLAVATSIDELLRASWLETLLKGPRTPAPPAPVRRAVESSLPEPPVVLAPAIHAPQRRVRLELGATANASVMLRSRTGFGLDLHGSYWATRRVGGYVRVGFNQGLREDGLTGSIAAHQLRAGSGLLIALLPAGEKLGLRAEAGLDASRVGFHGLALDRTVALDTPPLFALTATVGLRTWLDTGPVRWLLGLAAQYALVSATGTERLLGERPDRIVTGIDGLGFEASLGGAWRY